MRTAQPPERWLPVPGYEGLYEVSDLGNVRPVRRLLKPQVNTHGYLSVTLSRSGKTKTIPIHVLVCDAFLGPRPVGQERRHGPGGQRDNSVANLSFGTPPENQRDRVRDGTTNRGERSANAKLTAAIVAECRARYVAGQTQASLAAEFGVTTGAMCNAIRGKTWTELPGAVQGGKPSQRAPAHRAAMAEAGRRGAAARWGQSSSS